MIKFVVKRLLAIIPMMLIIIFIVFALVSMSDVDPGRLKLGGEATEEEVHAYNEALGLYDPLIVRYGKYVFGILKGDFGTSYYYNEPVMSTVMGRWPNTIRLTLLSVGIAMVVGISLGVLSAVKQYSILDRIATVASMLLSAIPTFCMAALLAECAAKLGCAALGTGRRNWHGAAVCAAAFALSLWIDRLPEAIWSAGAALFWGVNEILAQVVVGIKKGEK